MHRPPDLWIPLLTNLAVKVPAFGGGSNITFARTSTATITDWEGVIKVCQIDEARFHGARRVFNMIAGSTVTIGGASWTLTTGATVNTGIADPNGGVQAVRLNRGSAVDGDTTLNVSAAASGNNYLRRFIGTMWMRGEGSDVGKTVTLICKRVSGAAASASILYTLTAGWQRISTGLFAGLVDSVGVQLTVAMTSVAAQSVLLAFPQNEEVSAQSNQNPSEFVSVGVLPAPFHGAGVDGVRYFDCQHANTVADGVVTEASGPCLPRPAGLVSEGSRTNQEKNGETPTVEGGTGVLSGTTVDRMGQSAHLFTEDTGNTSHFIRLGSDGAVNATHYALSCYVKAGTASKCQLTSSGNLFSNTAYANYDLVALTVLAAGATALAPFIEDVGDGWRRIGYHAITNNSIIGSLVIIATIDSDTAARLPVFVGSGRTLFRAMGQFEAGESATIAFASTYIPTTTASVTRAAETCQYLCDYMQFNRDVSFAIGFSLSQVVTLANRRVVGLSGNTLNQLQLQAHSSSATPANGLLTGDGAAVITSSTGNTVAGRGYVGAIVKRKNPNPLVISGVGELRESLANAGIEVVSTQLRLGSAAGDDLLFGQVRNFVLWNSAVDEGHFRTWGKSL